MLKEVTKYNCDDESECCIVFYDVMSIYFQYIPASVRSLESYSLRITIHYLRNIFLKILFCDLNQEVCYN